MPRVITNILLVLTILLLPNLAFALDGSSEGEVHLANDQDRNVGIWYSTWYAKQGAYIWTTGHGIGSTSQMVSDVNGDGKDDAAVYFNDADEKGPGGRWYIALSNGNGFGSYSEWVRGHGIGSTKQMLGDVNADGKADATVFFGTGNLAGNWYVALSNGKKFNAYTLWKTGHGIGSTKQMLGDVNGDQRDDAVVFFNEAGDNLQAGRWYVALSKGSVFGLIRSWVDGHGFNTSSQLLGDVNGDHKDDAVVVTPQGDWHVGLSTGNSFDIDFRPWILGHGQGSSNQLLGDVNGDQKADAVVITAPRDWHLAVSTGDGFQAEDDPDNPWKRGHGMIWKDQCPNYEFSSSEFLGDVYGDSLSSPVTFLKNKGTWNVMPANSKYQKPNQYNTWEAGLYPCWRTLKYIPKITDKYETYDSGDARVIDQHLSLIQDAHIDFLIFDETNGLNVDGGYIIDRAKSVAKRIALLNSINSDNTIKYSIAIGAVQSTHESKTVEEEACQVWNEFVASEFGGPENYFYLNNKPLLILFSNYQDRMNWENWPGSKYCTDQFTMRFAQGKVPENNTPPPSDYGKYFGWTVPEGSKANSETMVVMPGHNNQLGAWVSRTYNGLQGGFYDILGWQIVLQDMPSIAVISSFNEFAEETAVEPADTSLVELPSEKWYNRDGVLDSDYYWDMTKDYILLYKGLTKTRYEESDPSIAYSSTCWSSYTNGLLSAGTAKVSKKKSCTATFSYNGTKAEFISAKAKQLGKAKIYSDNIYQSTLDLYHSTTMAQQPVYTKYHSSSGVHTLKIEVLAAKNSKASNYYIPIDAFDVTS